MPFLNTTGIKRTPNLKRMQLEKERLSMVDAENARLLAQIKKLKGRPARAFTRSSAAEQDCKGGVLRRRGRPLTRSSATEQGQHDKARHGRAGLQEVLP